MFNIRKKILCLTYLIAFSSYGTTPSVYTISKPVSVSPPSVIFGVPDNLSNFTTQVFPKVVHEEIRKNLPISIYNIPLSGIPVTLGSTSICQAKIIGTLLSGAMGLALDRQSLSIQLTPEGTDGVRITATINPKIGMLARFGISLDALGCGRSYSLSEWEVALNKFSITINGSLRVVNGKLQLIKTPPPQITVNSIEGPGNDHLLWVKSKEGTVITDAATSIVSRYFGKSPAALVSETLTGLLKSPLIADQIMKPISQALIQSIGSLPSLGYSFSTPNGLIINSSLLKIGSITGMSGVAFSGQINPSVSGTADRSCSRGISHGTENLIFLNRPRPIGGDYFLSIPHKTIGDILFATMQSNLCTAVKGSNIFPTRLEPLPNLIFELNENPFFTGSIKITPEPMGTPSNIALNPGARVNWSGSINHDPNQISSINPPRAPIALNLTVGIPYRLTLPPVVNGLENIEFQNGRINNGNLVINNIMTANLKLFVKIRYDKTLRRIFIGLDKSSLQMTNVNAGVTDPALRAKVLPFMNMLQGLVRNKLISSFRELPEVKLSNEVMPGMLGFGLVLSGMEYTPVDSIAKFSLECVSNCSNESNPEIEEIHHCPHGWSRDGSTCTKGTSRISTIKTFRPLNEVEIRREFESLQDFKRLDPYLKTAKEDINSHIIGINGLNKIDCHDPNDAFYFRSGSSYSLSDRNACNTCIERSLGYDSRFSKNGKGWLWDMSMRACITLECAETNLTDTERSECMGFSGSGSYTEPSIESASGYSAE
jgi:hypothetical protein